MCFFPAALAGQPARVPERQCQQAKTLNRILRGKSDATIPFNELCMLLRGLGFQERTRGDHHIFAREGVVEIIYMQPKGSNAKPYQVKQVRNLILKYKLGDEND